MGKTLTVDEDRVRELSALDGEFRRRAEVLWPDTFKRGPCWEALAYVRPLVEIPLNGGTYRVSDEGTEDGPRYFKIERLFT